MAATVVRMKPESASVGNRAVLVYLAIAPGTELRHGLFAQGALAIGTLTGLAVAFERGASTNPNPISRSSRTSRCAMWP